MAKGNFTGTAASALIVAADPYRAQLTIQKTNATTVAIGVGEAAVAGEGIQLTNKNDTLHLFNEDARKAIYVIGNGGTGTYQTGRLKYVSGPYVES